ncbi:hypothetical protein QQF64_001668 [Cirrhinus molitorella]|uniref:Uncharacterized protein n=1 Tax=Cirrhinus molitorella TaxID=172907 RepID=A0ABR3P261_9TELE
MINWKALDNVPVLLYILALKTLLLCLAFAGAKIYQRRLTCGKNRSAVSVKWIQMHGLLHNSCFLYTSMFLFIISDVFK